MQFHQISSPLRLDLYIDPSPSDITCSSISASLRFTSGRHPWSSSSCTASARRSASDRSSPKPPFRRRRRQTWQDRAAAFFVKCRARRTRDQGTSGAGNAGNVSEKGGKTPTKPPNDVENRFNRSSSLGCQTDHEHLIWNTETLSDGASF